MRPAFVAQTLPVLIDQMNRAAARTRSVVTRLSEAVWNASQLPLVSTFYLPVRYQVEDGEILRYAHLIPSTTVAYAKASATYATVAVGVRRGAKFDSYGKVYDSRSFSLTEGVPLPLVESDVKIAIGSGLAVRVVFVGSPIPALVGSAVETFFGYEG